MSVPAIFTAGALPDARVVHCKNFYRLNQSNSALAAPIEPDNTVSRLGVRKRMLLLLAIILFIAWILGFVAFHVTVGFIHLLLVLAVIALIWHLVAGRRTVV